MAELCIKKFFAHNDSEDEDINAGFNVDVEEYYEEDFFAEEDDRGQAVMVGIPAIGSR